LFDTRLPTSSVLSVDVFARRDDDLSTFGSAIWEDHVLERRKKKQE